MDGFTKINDERGFFSEDYNKKFDEIGIKDNFIQDNIFSRQKNTIRGLHFQRKSFEQSKLIKVIQGSIFDVFIDLRKTLNIINNMIMLFKTKSLGLYSAGFAHGFCTLENDILYLIANNYYNKNLDS